jgi:hypothetical protein
MQYTCRVQVSVKDYGDQSAVITPLHAAAVNGDKASLNKLLNGWLTWKLKL